MKVLPSRDPNLFQVRTGGGCVSLFGMPFLLTGLGIMFSPLFAPDSSGPSGLIGTIPFGLIFAVVGGALVFGRGGIDVDLRRRELVRWWSAIVRVKSTVIPLTEIRQVTVTKEVRKNKNSTTTVYPIYVELAASRKNLVEDQDYQSSRRVAEGLARFAGVPMSDASSGQPVVRQPDELNESLRDRVRRMNERLEYPSPPAVSELIVRNEPEGMTIELPRGGGFLFALLPMIFFLGVFVFFLIPFGGMILGDNSMPFEMKLLVGGFFLFFFGLLPFFILLFKLIRGLTSRSRVVVDGRRLRVENSSTGSKKAVEIPADELEELTLSSPPVSMEQTEEFRRLGQSNLRVKLMMRILRMGKPSGITARSDKASVTFGENLSPEDQSYLYALVKQAVAG